MTLLTGGVAQNLLTGGVEAAGEAAGGGFLLPLSATLAATKIAGDIIGGGSTSGTPEVSGGAVAPQRTSGFLGIGARTIPGLVSPPNPAVYAQPMGVAQMPAVPTMMTPNLIAPQAQQQQALPNYTQHQPMQAGVSMDVDEQGNPMPQPGGGPTAPPALMHPEPAAPQPQQAPAEPPAPPINPIEASELHEQAAPHQPELPQGNYPSWAQPFQQFAPAVEAFHGFMSGLPDQFEQAAQNAGTSLQQFLDTGGLPPAEAQGLAAGAAGSLDDAGELPKTAPPVGTTGYSMPGYAPPNRNPMAARGMGSGDAGDFNRDLNAARAKNARMRGAISSDMTAKRVGNQTLLKVAAVKAADSLANDQRSFADALQMNFKKQIQMAYYGAPGDPEHGIAPIEPVMKTIKDAVWKSLTDPIITVPIANTDQDGKVVRDANGHVSYGSRVVSPLQYQNILKNKVAGLDNKINLLNSEDLTDKEIDKHRHYRKETPGGILPNLFGPLIHTNVNESEVTKEAEASAWADRRLNRKSYEEQKKVLQEEIAGYDKLIEQAKTEEKLAKVEYLKSMYDALDMNVKIDNMRTDAEKGTLASIFALLKQATDDKKAEIEANFRAGTIVTQREQVEATRANSSATMANAQTSRKLADLQREKIDNEAKEKVYAHNKDRLNSSLNSLVQEETALMKAPHPLKENKTRQLDIHKKIDDLREEIAKLGSAK